MLYICQLLLQPRFANLTDATGGKLECFYNQLFPRHAESHQLVVRIFLNRSLYRYTCLNISMILDIIKCWGCSHLVTSCGEISVQVSIPTCVTCRQASGHLHLKLLFVRKRLFSSSSEIKDQTY